MQLSNQPLVARSSDGVLRVIHAGSDFASKRRTRKASTPSARGCDRAWLRQNTTKADQDDSRVGEQASGWLAENGKRCFEDPVDHRLQGTATSCLSGKLREIYRNPEFQWSFVHKCRR